MVRNARVPIEIVFVIFNLTDRNDYTGCSLCFSLQLCSSK